MKFLVDMPLAPELARWLSVEGHDAVHASQLNMQRSPDAEIMRVAAAGNRVIITADLDFPRLLATLGATGPGLVLLRGGNYSESESLDWVRRVLASVPEHELTLPSWLLTVRESGGVGSRFSAGASRIGATTPPFLVESPSHILGL